MRALTRSEFDQLFAAVGLAAGFQAEVPIDMDFEEWLAHGGPDASTAAQIRTLMESAIETDRCALNVRCENGGIRFTYATAVFLLERAA